ncbi:hypothetical protein HAX54_016758 [Datura stramonium]|uniref:Uncharacterized protein n=1 Tax=Datura stramonium TaxID=4076 RepID=A0ABS8UJG5_DATST|nr:hypothetical protein [Datura stramonium]
MSLEMTFLYSIVKREKEALKKSTLSIFVLKSVSPALEWILPSHCPQINSQESCSFSSILEFYRFLRVGLIQLFYVFWFYPLYIFSLILSNIW